MLCCMLTSSPICAIWSWFDVVSGRLILPGNTFDTSKVHVQEWLMAECPVTHSYQPFHNIHLNNTNNKYPNIHYRLNRIMQKDTTRAAGLNDRFNVYIINTYCIFICFRSFSFEKTGKLQGAQAYERNAAHASPFLRYREPLFILLFCVITMC